MIGIRVKSCRHKVALRRLRKAVVVSTVVLIGCCFAYQATYEHSNQLSMRQALEIVNAQDGDERIRRQAHLVLDKLNRESREALVIDAAKPGALGRDAMNRLKIGCMMTIQSLRELQKVEGEVSSAAHVTLEAIAREAHNR